MKFSKYTKDAKDEMETEKSPKKDIGSAKRSSGKVAWGIDIGDSSLKAAKISFRDGKVNVLTADRIDYATPDQSTAPDKSKMIEEAVGTFISRNSIDASDKIIISISGRMVLSRFISLPPMKKARITDAIKFELRKQIPFDPSEIVWDSYRFENIKKSSKGVEVGIFATKKENIYSILPSLTSIKMNIEAIQTTPVAVYNLVRMLYATEEDVIVINVEKGDTDFIVAGKAKFWNRSISISEINMDFVREIQRSMVKHKVT